MPCTTGETQMLEIKPYPLDNDYMVYSDGRIWAKKKKPHFLVPQNNRGYMRVCITINGVKKSRTVHRMVAETFLDNPDNLPQINHIDEDKTNNDVSNLEYCTAKYNSCYGSRLERMGKTRRDRNCKGKPVYQLDDHMNIIAEYPSTKKAGLAIGKRPENIASSCKNPKRFPHIGGYRWRYKEDYDISHGGEING